MHQLSFFDCALFPVASHFCKAEIDPFNPMEMSCEQVAPELSYNFEGLLMADLIETMEKATDWPRQEKSKLKEKEQEKEKKQHKKVWFIERAGDWVCAQCRNMNFSFRKDCNKCGISKEVSFKMLDEFLKTLQV